MEKLGNPEGATPMTSNSTVSIKGKNKKAGLEGVTKKVLP